MKWALGVLSHIHLQLGYLDATCIYISYSILSYFSHGVLAWIITASAILEPCLVEFPCQDWDSVVHWDAFGHDLVHLSRVADQIWYTQLQRGPIRWRQVYMVRSGICFPSLILLYDVCQTPRLVLLGCPMIMVTYAYICILMLELVLKTNHRT